ncbi:copper chaperone for superoxide dismutase isoform X3 [Sipha flava]|uniref:Superoxide dismutase copper chaperone n=1 Tax=Sipha flava TaxID=143950 RepID=A0A8B8FJ26_9HEMI|nr:copper chaperone for superoxide dismutase isoform X3 [Sipha flava]
MLNLQNLEFAVQISSSLCADKVLDKLNQNGISKSDVQICYKTGTVIVKSDLPSSLILNAIEKSGYKAVLKGYGSSNYDVNLGAAVAMLCNSTGHSDSGINGVVRFIQLNENECLVDGTIDGLSPGKHGIHIYECGDLSNGCENIGEHLNFGQTLHGNQTDDPNNRHTGDLGNITANEEGRAIFYFKDKLINVSNLIGRSIGITEHEDDCGRTRINKSEIDGNSGKKNSSGIWYNPVVFQKYFKSNLFIYKNKIACGIIARSSGLFENSKKICACDGVTLWEERDVPLAGPGRQRKNNN